MTSVWNEKNIERLKELRDDPACYTAAQIGEMMGGLSKNTILGKLNRMGGKPMRNAERRKAKQAAGASNVKPFVRETAAKLDWKARSEAANIPLPESRPVTLSRRASDQCCWPMGNPRNPAFRYCGASIEPGGKYCVGHMAMAYRKSGDAA